MDMLSWLRKQLEEADVDLLCEMVSAFVTALMGAEADAVCNAGYGEKNPDRVNSRNGYRPRTWDTRAGAPSAPSSRSSPTATLPLLSTSTFRFSASMSLSVEREA